MLFNGKYYNKPGHLGMTTKDVKEALAGGASAASTGAGANRNNIVITIPDADATAILSGVTKTYQVSEEGFVLHNTTDINTYPESVSVQIPGITITIFPHIGLRYDSGAISYSTVISISDTVYFLFAFFSWNTIIEKWDVRIGAITLVS